MNQFDILLGLGAIAFVFGQWRNGRRESKAETVSAYNGTIELLKSQISALESKSNQAEQENKSNHDEILKLQEAIKHKDQQIDQYLKIITNRNPQLEETLKQVRDFLEVLNKKMVTGTALPIIK